MCIKRLISRVRKPYHISIVGEMILNSGFWKGREHEQWDAGRIEVYKDGPYAEEEIRFFTNKEEWFAFRGSSDFKSYFNSNVKFIEVKSFSRSVNIKNDINAYFELIKIEKEIKPDIIHLHSSKAGILGRLAFDSRKRKIFYTPHAYAFLKKDCFDFRVILGRVVVGGLISNL